MAFCLSLHRRLCLLFCLLSVCRLCEASPAAYHNGTSDILTDSSGTLTVIDPDTHDEVAQASAGDGAGSGMNLPAILWIVFVFVTGIPLAIVGVRLGRFTSGVGVGLALAVGIWASIINTVSESGISDGVILGITALFLAIGFVVGVVIIEYGVGAAALAVAGGLSVGMRVLIMKDDLLVPVFYVNWLICAAFGVAGLLVVVWRERTGVIVGGSAAGSFLVGLGIDLTINKQNGMSRGLRYLFDRNKHHIADIFGTGYSPPVSTRIIMGVTIAAIPILGFAQHKLFPGPFQTHRHRSSSVFGDSASVRSQTWHGRLRGRRRQASDVEDVGQDRDESDSSSTLVAGDDASKPLSHQRHRDETTREKGEGAPPTGQSPQHKFS